MTSWALPNPYNGLHIISLRTDSDRMIRTPAMPPGEHDWFDLSWSPDSKTIAYRTSGGRIVIVNADGSGRRALSTLRGRKSSPTWSPDGKTIAFAEYVGGVSSIYRVDLHGGNLRLLAKHASAPAWSRDGIIAYHTVCGIKLMKGDGTPIVPKAARSCGAVGMPHLAAPAWSPDGKRIAATLSRRLPDQERGTYVMRADGTAVYRLTPATLAVFIGQRPRIAWQPIH